MFWSQCGRKIASFHRNEKGLEALQVVMIIAIASLFLIAVKYQWQDFVEGWFKGLLNTITGWQPTNGEGQGV